jgi:hypothetical protein
VGSYDFVYGSKVLIQCQAQINVQRWAGDEHNESTKYLLLIKKTPSFFSHWCKPRRVVKCIVSEPPKENLASDVLDKVGTNIDDRLIERDRVLTWSKTIGNIHDVSHSGHGKIMITLNAPTFCARDMGITFDPKSYSYSVSS